MASMSESLECSVCLGTYNLSDRLPKALTCQHTICGQCVDQLKQGTSIKCPTCRWQCSMGQVAVNFDLTHILQGRCQLCHVKSQKVKCSHCKKKICEKCHETHKENVHKELILELTKLEHILRKANDISNDDRILDQEHEKEAATIDEIRQVIKYHRDALDKLEKEMESKVRALAQRNSEVFMEYMSSLNETIIKGKGFHMQTKNKVGLRNNKHSSVAEMTTLMTKSQDLVDELTQQTNRTPALEDYSFNKAAGDFDPLSVGKLVTGQNSRIGQQAPGASSHTVLHYTTLRYHSHTGSNGSEPSQFDRPHSVLCPSDQVIVSDFMNHRVKFYDTDLNLQFMIGEFGSGRGQFNGPTGLATGSGGEVYVCDYNNHRIVVMSARGEYVHEFGTMGSGTDGLLYPAGIAVGDGYVYIADSHNYRIKVVKTDGTFVQNIGSKGKRPGEYQDFPRRVAVMSPRDGRVLVKEEGKQQLHVYSRAGKYQGLFPSKIPIQLMEAYPNDLTVDTADNVIITYNTNQLAVYDSCGGLITVVGSQGLEEFRCPTGVSVNTQSGHLVVCDWNNNCVQMYTLM